MFYFASVCSWQGVQNLFDLLRTQRDPETDLFYLTLLGIPPQRCQWWSFRHHVVLGPFQTHSICNIFKFYLEPKRILRKKYQVQHGLAWKKKLSDSEVPDGSGNPGICEVF